jgi:hypothetical protein
VSYVATLADVSWRHIQSLAIVPSACHKPYPVFVVFKKYLQTEVFNIFEIKFHQYVSVRIVTYCNIIIMIMVATLYI